MEKVLGTIQVYQKELRCDNTYAGAMYSGDLTYSVEFVDEEWLSYDTLEWYGANVIDGSSQVLDYDFATKKLKVPYGLYQQDGLIYITLRGVSGDVKYSADLLRLNVGLAVDIENNDVVEDPSWIDTATKIIEELITNKYDPVSNELIAEAKRQQEAAKTIQDKVQTQQTQIDTAVSQLGVYEWNGSQIRFKQGDGTWGEWHDVAGDFLTIDDYVNGMIESGEEYSGPASDKGIKLHKVVGKTEQGTTKGYQLFDASKLPTKTQGGATVTNNNDGSFTISGSGTLSDYFSQLYVYNHKETLQLLKTGKIYAKNNDTIPRMCAYLYYDSESKYYTLIDANILESNITEEMLSKSDCRLRIYIYGDIGNAIKPGTIKPMLYQDGDGTWEPFTGGQPAPNPDYPMEIQNVEITEIYSNGSQEVDLSTKTNTVETSLKLAEGETYIDGEPITRKYKQITFDGSDDENWIYQGSGWDIHRFDYYITDVKMGSICKANRFPYEFTEAKANVVYISAVEKKVSFMIDKNIASNASAFKTWLQTHPVTVEYELSTPTTETLKIPTVPSYYPNTNIWTDNTVPTDIQWRLLPHFDVSSELKEIKDELNNIGDSVSELLTKPEIFSGTGEEPPAEWKDGDIYIMYEE